MRRQHLVQVVLAVLFFLVPPASAAPVGGIANGQCQSAVARAETSRHLPDAFLAAIARVETGRPDPVSGIFAPWPWSVNAEGVGTFYANKADAIAAVRALQARGVASIDVGCLQVNLKQHPEAFTTLDRAFDPDANAAYAADFLRVLFGQTGSWPLAAAAYHSLTPGIGSAYQQRVLAEWAVPQNEARLPRRSRPVRTATASQNEIIRATAQPTLHPAPAGGAVRLAASAPAQFPLARPLGMTGRSLAAYRLLPTRLAFPLAPAPS